MVGRTVWRGREEEPRVSCGTTFLIERLLLALLLVAPLVTGCGESCLSDLLLKDADWFSRAGRLNDQQCFD